MGPLQPSKIDNKKFWIGVLFCVTAALAWSILGPVSRVCFAEGMSPTTTAFWRLLLSGTCFLIQSRIWQKERVSPRNMLELALFGVFCVSATFVALQVSIQRSGSALAIILMFTAPIWVAVISRMFFNETLTPIKVFATATALAGTICVCISGGSLGEEISYIGIGAGLLSGITYALQFFFFVRMKDRCSTAAVFAYSFLPTAMFLAFFSDFSIPSIRAAVALVSGGILSTYLAYYLYGQSLRYLTPVQAAIIGNLEPVANTMLSWWFWNENFSLTGWVGCALVIFSVIALSLKKQ